jgi:hypothetical protein
MGAFFATVIRETLIEKKDSAYLSWRKTVDETLQQTSDYATQPTACYRFVLNEPIKGYKMAKTIMGDLYKKQEEE